MIAGQWQIKTEKTVNLVEFNRSVRRCTQSTDYYAQTNPLFICAHLSTLTLNRMHVLKRTLHACVCVLMCKLAIYSHCVVIHYIYFSRILRGASKFWTNHRSAITNKFRFFSFSAVAVCRLLFCVSVFSYGCCLWAHLSVNLSVGILLLHNVTSIVGSQMWKTKHKIQNKYEESSSMHVCHSAHVFMLLTSKK